MAQNVTVAGASYSDVPAVQLPKTGGGTATFYDADFKTITQTLTSVTSSADETRVETGNSFFAELTPANGYVISSITVTMGGVDITDQVFKPGTGAKTITANGTYSAASDNLSGYTAVSVNVPSGSASLGTKSITSNGTYNASSDGYDGYSQVTVNVPNTYSSGDEGKGVSNGSLVPQTSDTVTENGTVDTTLINSLTVNVGGGTQKTLTNSWDFKTSLVDSVGNLTATLGGSATRNSSGVSIASASQYITIPLKFSANKTYEIDIASLSKTFTSGHGRLWMVTGGNGFIWRSNGYWSVYFDAWGSSAGNSVATLSGKTLRITTDTTITTYRNGTETKYIYPKFWVDGTLWYQCQYGSTQSSANMTLGASSQSFYGMTITGFRVYDGCEV